jgi:hypothetical protein
LAEGEHLDTSTLEHIAEDYISHKLQKGGLLVAKPKNDRLGTDLLAFNQIEDGVKFCRVQVKGRTLTSSKAANIKVPKEYVSFAFILFLYLEVSELDHESEAKIFVFFGSQIENWTLSPRDEYQLSVSCSNYEEKLKPHRYSKEQLTKIKEIIKNAEMSGEFKRIAFISANILEEGDTVAAHITVGQ